MAPTTISVLVPVYNNAESLPELLGRLTAALDALGHSWQVILVNDGSADASWARIEDLCAGDKRVLGIDLTRNYGQHNALLCGLREATGDVIVTMDADLQNPPEEIGKLVEKLDTGVDVVYGVPEHETHGALRNLASVTTKFVMRFSMGVRHAPEVSAFRAFRAYLREGFGEFRGQYVSLDVLLSWTTTRFTAVKVRHDPRTMGRSTYTWSKLAVHALNMVTGFSTIPLRLASLVGFGFTIVGAGLLAYVLGRFFLTGQSIPGFPFLASTIAIFAGAQLFALGILGEYVGRIFNRSLDRPSYMVRRRGTEDVGAGVTR